MPCRQCGNTALLRCGHCKRAQYCSSDCQKNDWKNGFHRDVCFAIDGDSVIVHPTSVLAQHPSATSHNNNYTKVSFVSGKGDAKKRPFDSESESRKSQTTLLSKLEKTLETLTWLRESFFRLVSGPNLVSRDEMFYKEFVDTLNSLVANYSALSGQQLDDKQAGVAELVLGPLDPAILLLQAVVDKIKGDNRETFGNTELNDIANHLKAIVDALSWFWLEGGVFVVSDEDSIYIGQNKTVYRTQLFAVDNLTIDLGLKNLSIQILRALRTLLFKILKRRDDNPPEGATEHFTGYKIIKLQDAEDDNVFTTIDMEYFESNYFVFVNHRTVTIFLGRGSKIIPRPRNRGSIVVLLEMEPNRTQLIALRAALYRDVMAPFKTERCDLLMQNSLETIYMSRRSYSRPEYYVSLLRSRGLVKLITISYGRAPNQVAQGTFGRDNMLQLKTEGDIVLDHEPLELLVSDHLARFSADFFMIHVRGPLFQGLNNSNFIPLIHYDFNSVKSSSSFKFKSSFFVDDMRLYQVIDGKVHNSFQLPEQDTDVLRISADVPHPLEVYFLTQVLLNSSYRKFQAVDSAGTEINFDTGKDTLVYALAGGLPSQTTPWLQKTLDGIPDADNDLEQVAILIVASLQPIFAREKLNFFAESTPILVENVLANAELLGMDYSRELIERFIDPPLNAYTSNHTQNVWIFPRTKRPVTFMNFAKTSEREDVGPGQSALPVVRYADRMGGTPFHGQIDENQLCGTYYFFEPDSKVAIVLPDSRTLWAKNKMHAVFQLSDDFDKAFFQSEQIGTDMERALKQLYNLVGPYATRVKVAMRQLFNKLYIRAREIRAHDMVFNWITYHKVQLTTQERKDELREKMGDVIADALLDESPISDLLTWGNGGYPDPHSVNYHFYDNNDYLGGELEYGFFDILDCIITKSNPKKYDLVFLHAEPGRYRPVTELVDLRPRKESYASIKKFASQPLKVDPKFPTIFFDQTLTG